VGLEAAAVGQGLTLVPTLNLSLLCHPYIRLTRGCLSKVLKLSSNVSDVFPKVLK